MEMIVVIKKIYHGSKDIVKQPEYGKGKTYNDYGLGFYCTDTIEMAKEWGVDKTQDGYANEYEIDTQNLKILDLNEEKYSILHWLSILLENRIEPAGRRKRPAFCIKNGCHICDSRAFLWVD